MAAVIKCISSFWTPVFDFLTGWWTFSLLSAGTMWLNLELRESCGQLLQPGPNSCLGNCVNLHFRLLVACGHRWLNMKHRLSLASHVHNKPVFLVVKVKHLWDICALGPYMFTLYTLNKNGHFLFVRTNMLFLIWPISRFVFSVKKKKTHYFFSQNFINLNWTFM